MANNSILNPTGSVTQRHRTAFILLLDLSVSMTDVVDYGTTIVTKSVALSDVSNKILKELYMRSFRDNEVCDYFDVAIITYSGERVESLLTNELNDPFVSIKDIADNNRDKSWINLRSTTPFDSPESIERLDESTIVLSAGGSTPMYEALGYLYRATNMWCSRNENFDSPPPVIIQISDGHPTDCALTSIIDISNKIKGLHTNCGNALLLNIKFESSNIENQLLFPTDEEIEDYPCLFVRTLARSSSIMPESFTPLINEVRKQRSASGYRGFGCNISVADIISMINIGTLSAVIK